MVFSNGCLLRDYGSDRKVCVCNEHFCDTIDPVSKIPVGTYWKYTSNMEGKRFEKKFGLFKKTSKTKNVIKVRSDEVYQTIHGFGGSFTDAVGINIMLLSENLRDKIMK